MKRLLLFSALLLALALPAQAQFAQPSFGVHGGYDLEAEGPFVGLTAQIPLPSAGLALAPSVDYFLNADYDAGAVEIAQQLLVLNLDVIYLFGIDNQTFTPYAGLGAGLLYRNLDDEGLDSVPGLDVDDSSTNFGVNLTGGALFGSGALRPFAAARVRLTGDPLTSLMGGVMFSF